MAAATPSYPKDYTNYDQCSEGYDTTRQVAALSSILGAFAIVGKSFDKMSILEAGCGTGNYTEHIKQRFNSCHGLELSEGMVAIAQRKTKANTPCATYRQGSVTQLPYAAEQFDAVFYPHVIHHLPKENNFAAAFTAFKECYRVLKPGGVCVVTYTRKKQMYEGVWWSALIPERAKREYLSYKPSFKNFQDFFAEAGFGPVTFVVDHTATLQKPDEYLREDGPLKKHWRDGDSLWSVCTEEEIKDIEARVRQMIETKTMAAWLKERERKRLKVGQITILFAQKSSSA